PENIGEYLADMAAMETAAITAFDYLSRELEAYAAPVELIARARQAVAEETRHAEMAGLLSAAYDTTVPEVSVDEFSLRSLYEIALENAVEGCVNETFAAACGLWQSEHAALDVFRQVISHITDEEMGHAALSWDIHAWIMPQLTVAEQAQIRTAQAEAVEKLMIDFKQEGNPVLQQTFGLPTRAEAARLFVQLKDSVWASLGMPNLERNTGMSGQQLTA
ncbi:MAG: ferritin-like domain-containing protein, partial [Thiolinea sp.]